MATKADFTHEEWRLLATAPFTLSLAVSAADMSGPLGLAKEGFAVAQALVETERLPTTSALVRELVADVKARTVKPESPSADQAKDVTSWVHGRAREVVGLLDRKAPDESLAIRQWLHGVAVKVAEASKEGGFLGIGGVKVSEDEQRALDALAGALGLAGGVATPTVAPQTGAPRADA